MFKGWNELSVRFMWDAAGVCHYYHDLANMIRPHLSPDARICDAGCGIGALSLALAPYCKEVTAWDISPEALSRLRTIAPSNVLIRCEDIFQAAPAQKYDAMVFSFFGSIQQIISIAQTHCTGTVFAFMKNRSTHRFSVSETSPATPFYQLAAAELKRLQIPFESGQCSAELGQPLRNLEDARSFFQTYNQGSDNQNFTDDFLLPRLVKTNNEEFPFYLPQTRDFGWIRFQISDIPNHLEGVI